MRLLSVRTEMWERNKILNCESYARATNTGHSQASSNVAVNSLVLKPETITVSYRELE